MKKPPKSADRSILSIFPFLLVSTLFIGTARLVIENSYLGSGRATKRQLSPSISRTRILDAAFFMDPFVNGSSIDGCDVFEGKWILDNASHPLYAEESCPYLTKQVTCQKNGRPDSLYQNWRWKPHGCELPRFGALKLLEVLRGKRIMFIGDSLQRTQWESMVCLIQSVIPEGKKSVHRNPPMKTFIAEDFKAADASTTIVGSILVEYEASIVFYWAPFIVESNSDHATNHSVLRRMVKLDSIASHGQHWNGADVLVFDSYVWWMYKPTVNATMGPVDNVQEYNVTTAYRIALRTWSNWLESNIDPLVQKVFFMSMSPTHLWNWEWSGRNDGNCFNETYPIEHSYWGTGSNLEIMEILRETLQETKIDVTLLNITQLSEFRKDAHTSVFTERRGNLLTKEQKSDPNTYADCIHWCLPGVPDTWNEILYAYLLYDFGMS